MGYPGYVTLFQPSTDSILHSANLFISLLIIFSPKNESCYLVTDYHGVHNVIFEGLVIY